MGTTSGIFEAVATAPLRKTLFFAAALLGLLVIFGATSDTAFAKGKPVAGQATAQVVQADRGDITPTGFGFVISDEVFVGSFGATGIPQLPNGSKIRATQGSNVIFLAAPVGTIPIAGNIFGEITLSQRGDSFTADYTAGFSGTLNVDTGAISVTWNSAEIDDESIVLEGSTYAPLAGAASVPGLISLDATASSGSGPAPEIAIMTLTVNL